MFFVSEGSGKHRHTYTCIHAAHKGKLSGSIHLGMENLGTKVTKAIGFKEIVVGNKEFDDKYYVRVDDEADAMRVLNLDVQQKIMDAKIPLEIELTFVGVKELGMMDSEKIKSRLNSLCDIAEKVDSA